MAIVASPVDIRIDRHVVPYGSKVPKLAAADNGKQAEAVPGIVPAYRSHDSPLELPP